jgi:hypothetical protein
MVEEEEERAARRDAAAAARQEAADAAHAQKAGEDIVSWKARSRYMESADEAAARAIRTAARQVCNWFVCVLEAGRRGTGSLCSNILCNSAVSVHVPEAYTPRALLYIAQRGREA